MKDDWGFLPCLHLWSKENVFNLYCPAKNIPKNEGLLLHVCDILFSEYQHAKNESEMVICFDNRSEFRKPNEMDFFSDLYLLFQIRSPTKLE